jgi:O-antigen/teichoic acid export membrane protein
MKTTQRVFLNSATRWFAIAVQGALGLFLVRFLLSELGQDGYGLVSLMGGVIAFSSIAEFGLSGALSRYLAAQVASKNNNKFNELASTAMLFYIIIGTALAISCSLLAEKIAQVLNVPPSLLPQAGFLIRWYAGPAICLSFLSPLYTAVIASTNRFDILNWISIGTGLVRAVVLFLLMGLVKMGLYGWVGGMLFSQGLNLALAVLAAYRTWPMLRLNPAKAKLDTLHMLFSTGVYLFALQLANLLGVQADPLILTAFFGPAAVALYSPATTLVSAIRPLVTTLVDQLHPLATMYYESGQMKKLQEVLIRGTKYTLLLGVGACVVLSVFADTITQLWLERSLGSQYVVTAQVLVLWLAIDLLSYAGGTQWPVLLGMNRLRFLTLTQVSFAVLNVAASIVLVRFTSIGVVGVVIPTLVLALIRRPLIMVYTAHVCGLPFSQYLRGAYLRPAIVLTLLTGAAVIVRILAKPSAMLALLWGFVLGVLFIALCWWVGFDAADRRFVLEMLRPKLHMLP